MGGWDTCDERVFVLLEFWLIGIAGWSWMRLLMLVSNWAGSAGLEGVELGWVGKCRDGINGYQINPLI